jgi:hypothetical protein
LSDSEQRVGDLLFWQYRSAGITGLRIQNDGGKYGQAKEYFFHGSFSFYDLNLL